MCTIFKTGGLGDVLGSLPNQLAKEGVDVGVVLSFVIKYLPEKYRKQLEIFKAILLSL